MKLKRTLSVLLVLLLMVPLMTGCFNKSETANSTEPKVLRVLGYEWNVNQLGQLFEVTHENVTIELVDLDKINREAQKEQQENNDGKMVDPYDKIKEVMTGPNAPDVVYLDQGQLQRFVDDGLLQPLESFIEKDKYDLDKVAPMVRDGIKELGNGTLYALAPTFTSSALFYNKDFFTRRNIDFPTDGMTWEQIFNLSRSLKYEENGKKYYGLTFPWNDISNELSVYAAPLGLTMYDPEFKTMTINTPEWEKAWQTIIDMNKEEVIAPPFDWNTTRNQSGKELGPFADNYFINGTAAMMIGDYGQVKQLTDVFNGNYYYGPNVEPPQSFDWDVVTVPVHEQYPDIGGQSYMNNMMGINATAENADLAWQYISFINSDRVAKVLARNSYELVSRSEFVKSPEGTDINMAAFTTLKPVPYNTDNDIYKKFPNGNYYEIFGIMRQALDEVSKGNKTVSDALNEIQNKGQEILNRLNEELENGTQGDGPDIGIPADGGISTDESTKTEIAPEPTTTEEVITDGSSD